MADASDVFSNGNSNDSYQNIGASSLSGNGGAAPAGFDWNALASNPLLLTGLSMIGSNQAVGPAIASGLENAMKVRAANNQNQLQQIQLAQLKARANFNPSQYLLSNQQANVQGNPPPVVGPATLAALAGQPQPQQSQFAVPQAQNPAAQQQAQQIASNAGTAVPPWQPPQGAIGNVDLQSMLNAGFKAGMSPEEVQNIAGVIDPMTAIRMKLMSQPALVVGPQDSLVAPGMAQAAQLSGGQGGQTGSPQAPQGGAAPGVLYTNNNPPPTSDAAQLGYLTKLRDQFPVGTPQYQMYDAAVNKMSGIQQQQIERDKTYGIPTDIANNARAIASGNAPPITGRALMTPMGAQTMALARQINPGFNGTEFATAQKASNDFATGSQGDQVRAFGVATNHLGMLDQAATALQNGDNRGWNAVTNAIAKATGKTAPTNFESVRNLASSEVVNAITAGGGTQAERDQAQADISSANSPAQLHSTIQNYQGMMGAKLQGLGNQYKASTNRDDFYQKFNIPGASPSTGTTTTPATPKLAPATNFSVADRLAEARRRGLIQ